MRFHIESVAWQFSSFHISFGGNVIQTTRPMISHWFVHGFSETCWTWIDGAEYSLLSRITNLGTQPVARIMSANEILCEAKSGTPFIGQQRLIWQSNADAFFFEPRCCGGKILREDARRRIALWWCRPSVGSVHFEGIWRPELHTAIASQLFG